MLGQCLRVCMLCLIVPSMSILLGNTTKVQNLTNDDNNGPRRMAVIVSGLQNNFLIGSKIKKLVPLSKSLGYAVDFYLSLSANNNGAHFDDCFKTRMVEPTFMNAMETDKYSKAVHDKIKNAGANLKFLELSKDKEKIELPKDANRNRIWQYNPYKSPIGRNILRRYFSIERLANMAFQQERYEFMLVTRDDDHFLGQLNLSRFASWDNFRDRVFSKDCKTWYGVNDKTLLFGGEAANRTLRRLYSDFWMHDKRLDTYNAEVFLKEFIKVKGAISTPVNFAEIPSSDSVWVKNKAGTPVLCQRPHYLCDRHPNENTSYWQKLDEPNWCADLWTNLGNGEPDPHLEPKNNLPPLPTTTPHN